MSREELRSLKRLLPICTECKKVRDDADYWEEIEAYRRDPSAANLASGVCPACKENLLQREPSREQFAPAQ